MLTMRLYVVSLGLVLGLVSGARAGDRLIVTKTGQGIWATRATKADGKVLYVSRDTRQTYSVPVADLDGVVPTVQRGKLYEPDEIEKYIDRIVTLQRKHGRLYRQLNTILQEWKSLQRPSAALENGITEIENSFAGSDKGTRAYQQAILALEMVKYKDLGGIYTEKTDALFARLKDEYVAVNKQRIMDMAATPNLPIDRFVPMRQLAEEIREEAGDADKKIINDLLATTREAVYTSTCQESFRIFRASKSVDGYLESVRMLKINRDEVAATEAEKTTIDGGLARLREGLKQTQPSYRLNEKGYPFSQDDAQLLNSMQRYASRVMFVGQELDEQCLIIPETQPGRSSLRSPISVPLRLILNRGQRPAQELAVGVKLMGRTQDHFVRLGAIEFKNGHSRVMLDVDLSFLPDDFELLPNDQGETMMYVYLAALKDPDSEVEEWVPMSQYCSWPIVP
jgi:hypothetical protein